MFARARGVVLMLLVAIVTPARAQTSQTPETAAQQSARALAGPRVERTATAVRQITKTEPAAITVAAKKQQSVGKPVALMIVGGAAIILGAVIGGDAGALFMIGGAVAGLIGLYQYLQ